LVVSPKKERVFFFGVCGWRETAGSGQSPFSRHQTAKFTALRAFLSEISFLFGGAGGERLFDISGLCEIIYPYIF
jgi:hypothetical protein